ncbi:MAG: hypothetical protein HQ512_11070 [Rhodospirillales bacterium]|nr:hypothetical protein [Rhodospirillales bacterium]
MYLTPMDRTVIFGIAAAVMFSSTVMAQTVVAGTETGAFDQLSPGNQKIAQSLFNAQQATDAGAAFSLDDIALTKQDGTGWGNVFRQMKDSGLVQERNLGQIISGQGKTDVVRPGQVSGDTTTNTNTAPASSGYLRKPRMSKVVVTTANGNRVIVGLRKSGLRSKSLVDGSSGRMAGGGRNSLTTAHLATGRSANISRNPHGNGGKAIKIK